MQFDISTTMVAIGTILAVLGLQFLFFWCRDRRSPWLGWYSGTFLVGAAGLPSYMLPASGHEFLVYGVGNALRLAAFGFLWQGTRLFSGRPPEQLVLVLCCAVWLALCSMPAFLGSMDARIVGVSLFIALFAGLSAWELWRDRAEALPSRMPCMAVYLSFGALTLLRLPLVGMLPFPVGGRPVDPAWLAGFCLVVFAHASFLVALTLSMTRERRELEQRRFALSDPLTGLLNRRAFHDDALLTERRRDGHQQTAVLVLDLDDFKSVNDRYGHDAGDQVLQRFAEVARQSTRASDMLFRMGGEEFCFVLPGTSLEDAGQVAERIRSRFAATPVTVNGEAVHATVSIGIAAGRAATGDLNALHAAGDAAAYRAKALGRNLCVVADVAGPAVGRAPVPA